MSAAQPGLLETVPNFSCGTEARVVDALTAAMGSGGAYVADIHVDADHDRCVISAFGVEDAIVAGVCAAADVAIAEIDLRRQHGVHPRIGAVDVAPMIPLANMVSGGADATLALSAARRVGQYIGALHVPALRYGLSVISSEHACVAAFAGGVRRGGLAAVAERLAASAITPWFGPSVPHASAGVSIVGVRNVLIAFNLVLNTTDLTISQAAARAVRESSGGLRGVRAIGVPLVRRGLTQVSTNIEAWHEVAPIDVVRAVRESLPNPALVRELELVGLAPQAALDGLVDSGIPLMSAEHPTLEFHAQRALSR